MDAPMDALKLLDGFAGLAALVNSLLLWPVVKTLKQVVMENHGPRIAKLEKRQPKRPTRATPSTRSTRARR